MADSRFWCCERSFWLWATMPVGMCVRRTAESVLLTCWPPAPWERNVSIAQLVLGDLADLRGVLHLRQHLDQRERRVAALLGVVRADAHQPVDAALGAQPAVGAPAVDGDGGALEAGLLAFQLVEDLRRGSRAARPSAGTCARSISAQSVASVPPAPALMVMMASPSSYSPEKSRLVRRRS